MRMGLRRRRVVRLCEIINKRRGRVISSKSITMAIPFI